MAFSFLTQELAMDLGTANTVIFHNDQIVLDEPSIVAIDNITGKPVAMGQQAKLMYEGTNPTVKVVRPLKDGVIADFNAAEMMIKGFIKQVNSRHRSLFTPSLKVVVGIPSGSTEVEIRAVRDSAEHAGGRDVYLIFEPMAAALGIGLDVLAPKGNMVVDIGGGTAEIAVISLGGIVVQASIDTAGDVFTNDIQQYLRHCLDRSISKIEAGIMNVLEQTPPELYSDIVETGIYLSGGGSLLRGIAQRFTDKINIPFHVADDPLRAVARGTCIALKGADTYPFMMR